MLSARLVQFLAKFSFAAKLENISPWDVLIDPHFSFSLCCISQHSRGSNFPCRHLAGQPVKPPWTTSPLLKTSKCLYTLCAYAFIRLYAGISQCECVRRHRKQLIMLFMFPIITGPLYYQLLLLLLLLLEFLVCTYIIK